MERFLVDKVASHLRDRGVAPATAETRAKQLVMEELAARRNSTRPDPEGENGNETGLNPFEIKDILNEIFSKIDDAETRQALGTVNTTSSSTYQEFRKTAPRPLMEQELEQTRWSSDETKAARPDMNHMRSGYWSFYMALSDHRFFHHGLIAAWINGDIGYYTLEKANFKTTVVRELDLAVVDFYAYVVSLQNSQLFGEKARKIVEKIRSKGTGFLESEDEAVALGKLVGLDNTFQRRDWRSLSDDRHRNEELQDVLVSLLRSMNTRDDPTASENMESYTQDYPILERTSGRAVRQLLRPRYAYLGYLVGACCARLGQLSAPNNKDPDWTCHFKTTDARLNTQLQHYRQRIDATSKEAVKSILEWRFYSEDLESMDIDKEMEWAMKFEAQNKKYFKELKGPAHKRTFRTFTKKVPDVYVHRPFWMARENFMARMLVTVILEVHEKIAETSETVLRVTRSFLDWVAAMPEGRTKADVKRLGQYIERNIAPVTLKKRTPQMQLESSIASAFHSIWRFYADVFDDELYFFGPTGDSERDENGQIVLVLGNDVLNWSSIGRNVRDIIMRGE